MWKIIKQNDTRYLITDSEDQVDQKGEIVTAGQRWRVNFFGVPNLKREWSKFEEATAYVRGVEAATLIYGRETARAGR